MRVFAISDIHVDYEKNRQWVAELSSSDYHDDVLVLAGDISDSLSRLAWTLTAMARRFKNVLFVPGNHELWVIRDDKRMTSLAKFDRVRMVVEESGCSMKSLASRSVRIVPLLGWYDYSFGEPSDELRDIWMDYRACRWPGCMNEDQIAAHFAARNEIRCDSSNTTTITFSHFLPRVDVMSTWVPKVLYPVLGSARLEHELRLLQATVHIYGHSHINHCVRIDGVTYVNNALGYPQETRFSSKRLLCVLEI